MTSAAPYTTTAKSGQPVRNNGGVIPRGGATTAGSPVTVADNLTQGFTSRGVGGTTVLSKTGNNIGTTKAVSGADFQRQMFPGQYVMMRYGYIAGSNSVFLNSGAADFGRQSIHYKTTRKTRHITSWDYKTGVATTGAPTTDDFNADNAATPTRAIPGELQYTDHGMARFGALAVPIMDDYKPKTD